MLPAVLIAVKAAYGISTTSVGHHVPLSPCAGDFLRKSFDIKADAFGLLKGRQVAPHLTCAKLELTSQPLCSA